MNISWCIFIFFQCQLRLDAKKSLPKRSTLVEHHQFRNANEVEDEAEIALHKSHQLSEYLRMKAAEELLDMFGLQIPRNLAHYHSNKPPKYMVDLYRAVANYDGSTKLPDRMNAETVRSVPNKDQNCPNRCEFNLNILNKQETVTDAELHVFLQKPKSYTSSPNTYIIKIFQVYSAEDLMLKKVLVAARHLSSGSCGWQIFPFLTTITSWIKSKDQTLDLSIELITTNGDVIRQRPSSEDKQPIIVTFSNDRKIPKKFVVSTEIPSKIHDLLQTRTSKKPTAKFRRARAVDETDFQRRRNLIKKNKLRVVNTTRKKPLDFKHEHRNRSKNSSKESFKVYNEQKPEVDVSYKFSIGAPTASSSNRHSKSKSSTSSSSLSTSSAPSRICQRYPLYVDFKKMGWAGWIIFPRGYNAYHCKGKCSFPLGKHLKPSSHATVQSIMHVLGLGGQVELPCCATDTLHDITLLYFDQNNNAVLQRYKDMVAASCACK